ncbi:glycosyl hydrolase [Trujillonella endophytica]|uniref:Glycosyl hydrolase family 26 n=1 Tax=Trujillonella endophytica TaxID=673521 RepID=A0A1H8W108_9ACTN|nr:glycosyl hydrolase [Trujillella endophytica]SEP21331.1 Glycosyl hydrolase family 26 [Trujillella endophytica]
METTAAEPPTSTPPAPTTPTAPPPAPTPAAAGAGNLPSPSAGTWLSGASGVGAATGEFGSWRGRPLEIGGQWVDTNQDMVHLWGLKEEWNHWDGPIDVAIGAIGPGETWQQAATGAYDGRWRQSLTNLREVRGSRSGALFIRFAHESNGNWYPWSVDAGEVDAFRAAWQRFRALQQEIYPESQLVFNVNRESVGSGVDWRRTFPGARYVDVMSVDYYNQWPAVTSAGQWAGTLDDVDQYGAPKGLEQHRLFAESVGLPLAISEWSGNADQGGSAAFMEAMYGYLGEHAGNGPGEILYEILFNVAGYDGTFAVFGNGVRMPETAEAYRRFW